ncbi:venom allergen 5-like [Leguminivora glycinivorella]|uniref:venom allergen 5-like n=1 Tax=Leguminivora glycinivorella TaxID=1035111 RepID=UPI00200FA7E9|nr:venom allergen 5-like [Leguminivora glycinivorella]
MLAIELAAVLAALFACCSGASVNYCGAVMCGMTNAHTFCQFTHGPGPKCTGYMDDRLSGEEKTRLIGRMNRRRNEAALGKLQLPPASNMLKLRWVEELAREAQIWADQCNPPSYPEGHDACRDLYSITVGQCVASVVGEAPGLRPESMVDMWYLQGRQSPISADEKIPMDFGQMLWAHTYLVGCARSRFMIEQNGRLRTVTRLVCNFAPRGPEGPLWTTGAPASACPARSGSDPEFTGLCTFPETARQLEEALESMEKALESPPVSSKVRRELREPQESQEPKETPDQIINERKPQKQLPKEQTQPKEQSQSQRLRDIGTPDAAPIMSILKKYAPLMKGYENIFKRSDASNTTLTFVVLVLGFLVSNSL